jgi:hypothetical protein
MTNARIQLERLTEVDLVFVLNNRKYQTRARVMKIRPKKGVGLEFLFSDQAAEESFKELNLGMVGRWLLGRRSAATGPSTTTASEMPGHYALTVWSRQPPGRSNVVMVEPIEMKPVKLIGGRATLARARVTAAPTPTILTRNRKKKNSGGLSSLMPTIMPWVCETGLHDWVSVPLLRDQQAGPASDSRRDDELARIDAQKMIKHT